MCPIPQQPRDMDSLETTPDRVAHDACLDAVVESHHDQETGNKNTSSEQAERRTAEVLDAEHCAKSQQDNSGAAFGIEVADGVQAQETLFEARYLASQGVNFALLHTCTF